MTSFRGFAAPWGPVGTGSRYLIRDRDGGEVLPRRLRSMGIRSDQHRRVPRGKADRFDPTGMPWPRCCVRRATPPSHSAVVHAILQCGRYASIV